MKKILGLDLGTNSIGWSLVELDFDNRQGKILGMGSRIIPMGQDILGDFGKGNSVSQTAERTRYRSARRLRERYLLRRERLHRVLNVLGFLPEHYAKEIDFKKRLGKFKEGKEPKLVWRKNEQNKFEFIFQSSFSEMAKEFNGLKIPYDWTIYYLRKKALTERISKEELAWLILNFNQKRGYYQARGEEDEATDKREYVEVLRIVKIERGEVDKKNDKRTWYNLTLSNGWIYTSTFTTEPQWLNIEKEFLITEELDERGNVKIVKDKKTDTIGKEKRKITPLPSFEEIDLMSKADQDKIYKKIKAKTELTIINSRKTVGVYIYDTLLQKPNQKIRGKLIRTIERKFYKNELRQILQRQIELQPELFSNDLYDACIHELYKNNVGHQLILNKRDFVHLFLDDIIFYQRPLRSQKSSIGNCSLEFRKFKTNNGNGLLEVERTEYLKAIPKSNPYYQEFRIWQWIRNLSVYKKADESNVTSEFLNNVEEFEMIFEFLNNRREIDQKNLLQYLVKQKWPKLKPKEINAEIEKYRWNYVEDKRYPCNETRSQILARLKASNVGDEFLTREIEQQLWHIIYSVTDNIAFESALKKFASKFKLDEILFVNNFKGFKPFVSEYGSYSEKAIKKLLPLMRLGKYWSWEAINTKTQERINKIITGEFDENIKNRVREKTISLTEQSHFQGLPEWLAKYVVYDRHSEISDLVKWKSVDDLRAFLKEFKQHSLRNPIVERVVVETLRVVQDIWLKYGGGAENFLNEIHVELGRDMKNTSEERKRMSNQMTENENTNYRIKLLLAELKDSGVENVRSYSPMQHEILKIYEDGVLNSGIEIPDYIADTLKKFKEVDERKRPASSEIARYKLWLEQKYRSPYTGRAIPLGKLFTSAFEIEHIIPQSRYFDDSLSNKVICETAINKLKDNQLGLEFIKSHSGQIVETGFGETVKVFTEDEYRDFVKMHYENNRGKRNKLLLEEIPDKMIDRQLNDTRYISKYISSVLSNIVRENQNDDGVNSKNLIPGNGKITSILKQDWGLNDVWNELILPRFERINRLTKTTVFTSTNKEGHTIPTIPFGLSKSFQKKRIDHRHHAMDALIIACATRDHVNLLNNQSAKSDMKRYDLQYKLRNTEKWRDKNGNEHNKFAEFKKPWESFTIDAKDELEKIVVSFKQNLRVINKATNHYEKFKEGKKVKIAQESAESRVNWAIRKPMHEQTVSGIVKLPWVKVGKGEIITATRKTLDTSFDEDKIRKITDRGIQTILLNYLKAKGNNPEIAFSPEGLDDLNKNISQYNNGRYHQPIFKVRTYEKGKGRFVLGNSGNKKDKYVQGAPNLFFAIYVDENGRRSFETVPLNIVIERQKQGLSSVPDKNEKGDRLLFHLSPNDLVYVPTKEETENSVKIDFDNLTKEQKNRLFIVNDFSSTCYFTPNRIAKAIVLKEVDMNYDEQKKRVTGSYDTKTASFEGNQIKSVCIKLEVNRLGDIII